MKNTEAILNSIDIQKILPHRYPFLLVDKVTDMDEDKTITGIKNVTVNEPFFQGHFPGNPIMPGVLQCEALAQLTGVLLLSKEENKGKLGVFTGINNFKFRKQIVPGDTLVMQSEVLKYRHGMAVAKAQITVDGKVACMGEISFAVLDNPANEV